MSSGGDLIAAQAQRILAFLTTLLMLKVLIVILIGYKDYFPAKFDTGFLAGREECELPDGDSSTTISRGYPLKFWICVDDGWPRVSIGSGGGEVPKFTSLR